MSARKAIAHKAGKKDKNALSANFRRTLLSTIALPRLGNR